jgi:hypothetical protein
MTESSIRKGGRLLGAARANRPFESYNAASGPQPKGSRGC